MNILKKFSAGVAFSAAAVFSAQALPVTVVGVTFDPAVNPFTSQSVNLRQLIDPNTGVLTVFGIITVINGQGNNQFCASGCELTFSGTGFTPTSSTTIPTAGTVTTYSGGFINVYADPNPDVANPFAYESITLANTSNGNLFLSLANHGLLTGAVNASGSVLSGLGLLDAVGGPARQYFDFNAETDGADLRFSTSLTAPQPAGSNSLQNVAGTGNFRSLRANQVPEPGSLALVGLGLIGLFATSRRRKSV